MSSKRTTTTTTKMITKKSGFIDFRGTCHYQMMFYDIVHIKFSHFSSKRNKNFMRPYWSRLKSSTAKKNAIFDWRSLSSSEWTLQKKKVHAYFMHTHIKAGNWIKSIKKTEFRSIHSIYHESSSAYWVFHVFSFVVFFMCNFSLSLVDFIKI